MNLEILDISEDSSIMICDEQSNDVCEIHHAEYSTSGFPFKDAERLAHLIVESENLAATVEQLIDIITTDSDFARGYIQQIEQAQKVLRSAYGIGAAR